MTARELIAHLMEWDAKGWSLDHPLTVVSEEDEFDITRVEGDAMCIALYTTKIT